MKIEIEAQGYEVDILNDEYPRNLFGKVAGKLGFFPVLSYFTRRKFLNHLANSAPYDHCLIVKGRGMSARLVDDIRRTGAVVIAYNFDSFAFNPSPLGWFEHANHYYTFDFSDSEAHGLPRIDLFSLIEPNDEETERQIYISAILRNHSDRLEYVDRILRILGSEKIFIYVYELNYITFFINFIRNPRLYVRFWNNIHFKSLSYAEYVRVLKNSSFTIDYAHPKQSGITIRCFEAAATGAKIITNNIFSLEHPFFDETNTIVFDRSSDAAMLERRHIEISEKTPKPRFRSIATFIRELMAD